MSPGLPWVANRVGGIPGALIEAETGLPGEPDSRALLAISLAHLLSSSEISRVIRANGRKHILDDCELERQTTRLMDWYEQLIEQRPA